MNVPKRILLLDTGNEWGGGTNSMIELLKRLDRTRFTVTACFYHNYRHGDSTLQEALAAIEIPLVILPTRRQPGWAKLAKELELKGWDYPKHLAGRAFAVVVHGDAAGVEAGQNGGGGHAGLHAGRGQTSCMMKPSAAPRPDGGRLWRSSHAISHECVWCPGANRL